MLVALYHMHAQVIKRSAGHSAVAAAAYRAGEKLHDHLSEEEHDYSHRKGVEHSEIIAPDDAPDWARDRAQLWNQAEAAERRHDAQVAREVEVALPVELSKQEQQELVRDFAQEHFTSKGMVADISFHDVRKPDKEPNPHAHVMLTMRRLDGDRFAAAKERSWNEHALSQQWRKSWADRTNAALERGGHKEQVDHRTLKTQHKEALRRRDYEAADKLDREPQIHLGKALHMEEKDIPTARGDRYKEIANGNAVSARIEIDRNEQRVLQRDIDRIKALQQPDLESKVRSGPVKPQMEEEAERQRQQGYEPSR